MMTYGPQRFWLASAVLVSAALGVSSVEAAPRATPTVLLDGSPLPLEGAKPLISGGRVLVPMRAIFEALDADVEWDAASSTITAHTADNRTISLQPGVKSAAINGKLTRLDQPPVLAGGRVLVPLRFVSEALGATVTWNAPRMTVAVYRNQALQIQSVEVSGPAVLRAGQTIDISVQGPPGAQGTWRLLPGPTGLPLTEVPGQGGLYRGSYTVREGDDYPVTQPLARLTLRGQQAEKMADARLTLDTLPPRLSQQALSEMGDDEFQAVINVDENSEPTTWKVFAGYLKPGDSTLTWDQPLAVTQQGTQLKLRLERKPMPQPPVVEVRDAAGNRSQLTILLPGVEPPPPTPVNVDQKLNEDKDAVELAVQAAPGAEIWAEIFDPATQNIIGTIPLQLGEGGKYFGSLPLDEWDIPDDSQVRVQSRFGNFPPTITVIPLGLPPNWTPRPPRPRPERELYLDDVRVDGDAVLGLGDTLRVEARGSSGARATVDLGPRIGEIPLSESRNQRGRYTGTYTVRRGDDARNVRPEVRLERGGRHVDERANRSFDIDTIPPELRSTSVQRGQELDVLPEIIEFRYDEDDRNSLGRSVATLTTDRGKLRVPARIQGNEVHVALDRNRVNAGSPLTLEVSVADEAGNETRDSLDFKLRGGTTLDVDFDVNRPLRAGEDIPVTVNVNQWQRGRVQAALQDSNGNLQQPWAPLTGINGRFTGRLRAPAVARQQEFTVVAQLVDGNNQLGSAVSRRKLTVLAQTVPLTVEIVSVQPGQGQWLHVGDTVVVRIRSLTGARVGWTLGNFFPEQVLNEYPPGTGNYEGRYTIRPNDRGANIPLRVRAQVGTNIVTQDYAVRPGIDTGGPSIQLISPANNANLDEAPDEIILQVNDSGAGITDLDAQLVRGGGTVDLVVQAQGNRVRLPIGKRLQNELLGDIRLRVQAKDGAGNVTRANFGFRVNVPIVPNPVPNPQPNPNPNPQPNPQPDPEPQRAFVNITSPSRGGALNFPFTVRGTSTPRATVDVVVRGRAAVANRLLGRFRVKADANGNWETQEVQVGDKEAGQLRQVTISASTTVRGQDAADEAFLQAR